LELGCQIVMPTKKAQSNLKQESSICCKTNKQATEEEGKPERWKPLPSSSCCCCCWYEKIHNYGALIVMFSSVLSNPLYVTLQTYFSHPSLSYLPFFQPHP
jgi:hypothetical protein